MADGAVGGAQRREGEQSQRHDSLRWRRVNERVLSWEGGSEWRMAIEGLSDLRTGRLGGVRMRGDRVSTFVWVCVWKCYRVGRRKLYWMPEESASDNARKKWTHLNRVRSCLSSGAPEGADGGRRRQAWALQAVVNAAPAVPTRCAREADIGMVVTCWRPFGIRRQRTSRIGHANMAPGTTDRRAGAVSPCQCFTYD